MRRRIEYRDLHHALTRMTGAEKHAPSATSTLDALYVLYDRVLDVAPERRDDPDRDRFVLSKGHGPMAYYAVLAARGFFPPEVLDGFGGFDSPLGHHPDRSHVPGVEVSSGSLGHGLPIAVGIALAFWKVALKPGKPLVFGTREDRGAVLGLPGNPVSAFVTFHLFVRPVIRTLLGDAAPWPAVRRARLGAPLRHAMGRTELLRARLEGFGEDERVEVLPRQGSGALASLGSAEVLVVLPAEVEAIGAGERVWVWPLRGRVRELPTLSG